MQGQSYTQVGIYLCNEVFSHGQLYVALSCGRHPAIINGANDNNEAVGTVKNIVYHKIFTWHCHINSYKYLHLNQVDGKVKSLFQTLHV